MRKNNSKERRIEKQKKINKSLDTFYSEDQKQQEMQEKRRKNVQDVEMEIFEHLKEHTKKILKKK